MTDKKLHYVTTITALTFWKSYEGKNNEYFATYIANEYFFQTLEYMMTNLNT